MPTIASPELHAKAVSEVRNVAVDFRGRLDDGELLSGTPTVTQATLVPTNVGVNVAEKKINGWTVAIGQAVQFQVPAGGTPSTVYTFQISCATNSTPAQTLRALVLMLVVADS